MTEKGPQATKAYWKGYHKVLDLLRDGRKEEASKLTRTRWWRSPMFSAGATAAFTRVLRDLDIDELGI